MPWRVPRCGSHPLGQGRWVSYPASDRPGELVYGVTYRAWIPDAVNRVRGVIVHQHGCGSGAGQGGETAADDLHCQDLARKWGCALLGPSYKQKDGQDCRRGCDPRNGSRTRFLQALGDLSARSDHPELATAPGCLWGHSGGGFWASLMMASDPDRIVAAWLRSGTAFAAWRTGRPDRARRTGPSKRGFPGSATSAVDGGRRPVLIDQDQLTGSEQAALRALLLSHGRHSLDWLVRQTCEDVALLRSAGWDDESIRLDLGGTLFDIVQHRSPLLYLVGCGVVREVLAASVDRCSPHRGPRRVGS